MGLDQYSIFNHGWKQWPPAIEEGEVIALVQNNGGGIHQEILNYETGHISRWEDQRGFEIHDLDAKILAWHPMPIHPLLQARRDAAESGNPFADEGNPFR